MPSGGWRPRSGRKPKNPSGHAHPDVATGTVLPPKVVKTVQWTRDQVRAYIVGSKGDPLLYLHSVVQNEELPRQERLQAAAVMLSHVYPKMSQMVAKTESTNTDMKITFDFGRSLNGKSLEVAAGELGFVPNQDAKDATE